LKPREHAAYFISGKLLMVKDLCEESEGFFTQAIFLSLQQEASYFTWRGKALYFLKRYAEAGENFSKALALKPGNTSASRNLELIKQMLAKTRDNSTVKSPSESQSLGDTNTSDNITFDYESAFERAFGNSVDSGAGGEQRPPKLNMFNFRASDTDSGLGDLTPFIAADDFKQQPDGYYLSEQMAIPAISMESTSRLDAQPHAKNEPKKLLMDVSYARYVSTDHEHTVTSLSGGESHVVGLTIPLARARNIFDCKQEAHTGKEPPALLNSRRTSGLHVGLGKSEQRSAFAKSDEFTLYHATRLSEQPKRN